MGIDIVNLRSLLRQGTGHDDVDLPDADADLRLNQAYWELLDKFPFREKEVRTTFPTVAGTRAYNVPSPFEALRHLAVVNPVDTQHTPLDQMGIDVYEQKYNEDVTQRAIPTNYVREGCQVILWPTPDQVYTLAMRYLTVLADVGTGQNPNIPQSWHEIIVYGAIWRQFVIDGDYVRSAAAQKLAVNLINSSVPVEAKEEIDTRRAHLEVIVPPYP